MCSERCSWLRWIKKTIDDSPALGPLDQIAVRADEAARALSEAPFGLRGGADDEGQGALLDSATAFAGVIIFFHAYRDYETNTAKEPAPPFERSEEEPRRGGGKSLTGFREWMAGWRVLFRP